MKKMSKHKSFIFLLVILTFTGSLQAEDVVQVKPFTTTPGISIDDEETFSMEMVNTNAYTALEFHLFLPEGMTLDMDYPFDMNSDRFPGKIKKGVFIPNHDYDITNPTPGQYYVKIYNTSLETIEGTEGEILSFYYATSAGMKPGIYPIRVTGTVLAIDSHNGVEPAPSVSFVRITDADGNVPANALLDLGGDDIPSFVASELPEKNVIINGVCENLVLTDGADFEVAKEITATVATLDRQFTAGRWNTVCLPFDMTSEEIASQLGADVDVKEMTAVTKDGDNYTLTFSDAPSLQAGLPYIVRVTNDVNSISLENKVIRGDVSESTIDDVTYQGSFMSGKAPFGSYIISKNAFYMVNSDVILLAFRGYFTVNTSAEVKSMSFYIEGEDNSNAIRDVVTFPDAGSGVIYNLAGQRMQRLQKGISIVNGKKTCF